MEDQSGELGFFQVIHVKIDIAIHISISIRHMTIKFGKQVHLEKSWKIFDVNKTK